MRFKSKFEALSTRSTHVGEITRVCATAPRADEFNVILQSGAIDGGAPMHQVPQRASGAHLEGLRDYFVEWRVREKIVRQLAGSIRVGAGQLDGGGCAHSLVVVRISRQ